MADRITPFDTTYAINQRIDEIVATSANVHIEMLSEDGAWMQIGDDIFTIYIDSGKLFIAWRSIDADLQ